MKCIVQVAHENFIVEAKSLDRIFEKAFTEFMRNVDKYAKGAFASEAINEHTTSLHCYIFEYPKLKNGIAKLPLFTGDGKLLKETRIHEDPKFRKIAKRIIEKMKIKLEVPCSGDQSLN